MGTLLPIALSITIYKDVYSMTDKELAKSLLDVVFKSYGYKSTSVRNAIGELIQDVRADERAKFAKFMYSFLVENEYSSVSEILERIRSNDPCREDAVR